MIARLYPGIFISFLSLRWDFSKDEFFNQGEVSKNQVSVSLRIGDSREVLG